MSKTMSKGSKRDDRGSAMIVTLLVMAVLTGLGAVLFNVGLNNLQNAGRDRLAGGAMGAAEAGIAEAVTYIRINGTGKLTCTTPDTSPACTDNDWGFNNQHIGCIPAGPPPCGAGGRQFSVWIQRKQSYNPTVGTKEGIYDVHSVGTAGAGPGKRSIDTKVRTRPLDYPLGIYGEESIRNGGNPAVRKETMFSNGCIGKRSHIAFDTTGPDLAHPELIPAAHSTEYISEANILGLLDTQCRGTEKQNIHADPPNGAGNCNTTFKWDRDGGAQNPPGLGDGGPVAGTLCARSGANPQGYLDSSSPIGSFFDLGALKSYGYVQPRGLQDSQYAQIRNRAKEQGNFYDCTTSPTVPAGACTGGKLTGLTPPINGATLPNAVIYIKLAPGKEVSLDPKDVTGYDQSQCGSRSILIVVEGGDMHLNDKIDIVAAIFVPDGNLHLNGGARVVGTLFAKTVHFNGNGEFTLKGQCFFENLPGGLLSVAPVGFAELDR